MYKVRLISSISQEVVRHVEQKSSFNENTFTHALPSRTKPPKPPKPPNQPPPIMEKERKKGKKNPLPSCLVVFSSIPYLRHSLALLPSFSSFVAGYLLRDDKVACLRSYLTSSSAGRLVFTSLMERKSMCYLEHGKTRLFQGFVEVTTCKMFDFLLPIFRTAHLVYKIENLQPASKQLFD